MNLLVHMAVDGSHRDLEFAGQFHRRRAILRHVADRPDLLRVQFEIPLWTLFEFLKILSGDQPVAADLGRRKASIPNEGQHTLGADAQQVPGLLGGEMIHDQQS